MRKVIPYIASQFRKDKIWLRRTKPSKREYHICLAVDDSSSMVDNHSKQQISNKGEVMRSAAVHQNCAARDRPESIGPRRPGGETNSRANAVRPPHKNPPNREEKEPSRHMKTRKEKKS
ncbi:hypothetical protein F2P81_012518 [Scophthalmus maximus]|uniref:Uncharacterized protein n=1 Tax=Scophthalmus maximus TaxID=52904 RepID=A0A6A4SSB8_SCOMX|nr:hypothetical protein F2P81_012518 [Scophthalmus maximus]